MDNTNIKETIVELLMVAVISLFCLIIAMLEVETDITSPCKVLCGISFFSWVLVAFILSLSDYDGSRITIFVTTLLSAFIFGISLFSRHFLYSQFFLLLPVGQIILFMSYIFEFKWHKRQ